MSMLREKKKMELTDGHALESCVLDYRNEKLVSITFCVCNPKN